MATDFIRLIYAQLLISVNYDYFILWYYIYYREINIDYIDIYRLVHVNPITLGVFTNYCLGYAGLNI